MVLHANFVCELKIRIEKKMNLLVLVLFYVNFSTFNFRQNLNVSGFGRLK
jgi:hypothetical protein